MSYFEDTTIDVVEHKIVNKIESINKNIVFNNSKNNEKHSSEAPSDLNQLINFDNIRNLFSNKNDEDNYNAHNIIKNEKKHHKHQDDAPVVTPVQEQQPIVDVPMVTPIPDNLPQSESNPIVIYGDGEIINGDFYQDGGKGNDILTANFDTNYTYSDCFVQNGGDGNDILNYGLYQYGGEGCDILNGVSLSSQHGDNGNDILNNGRVQFGGSGNDILINAGDQYGGDGDDILIDGVDQYGGAGNDTLIAEINPPKKNGFKSFNVNKFAMIGGTGNDVYDITSSSFEVLYSYNSQLPIFLYDVQGNDILNFENISLEDVTFSSDRDNLIINVKLNQQAFSYENNANCYKDIYREIVIGNWYSSINNQVELFKFANDVSITNKEINKTVFNDEEFNKIDKTKEVFIGDDFTNLYGSDKGDFLDGSKYSFISGKEGNDTLKAGICTYDMCGDDGNDTYIIDQPVPFSNILEFDEFGVDTVINCFSYSLGVFVENLTLSGTKNNYAYGNELDNVIIGNSGNNLIIGNKGNDTLQGAEGDDIYQFGSNDGIDIINDTSGLADKIVFDNSISKTDISFYMDNSHNLIINYAGDNGTVTVQNQNINTIEKIELNNGQFLSSSAIGKMISDISSFASNNCIQLTSINDVKGNSDLMNIIATSWQS